MNQPPTSSSTPLTPEEGPYGPWVVIIADDGRRLGVAVTPHRCRTHLLIHDIDVSLRTYGRLNLPPTSNPWLHRVAELTEESDYHWDTPAYRSLCEQGGLDPDYRRPEFDSENAEAGEALLVELNRANALSPSAANLFMDIVDYLRIDPWVSDRKSVEAIRQNVKFNAEYDAGIMDEVRDLFSRLPALSQLRLM